MKKSVLSGGVTFALLLLPVLSFIGCYSTVEVGDSSADKAIAIDWVEPPCAEPGSAAGYIEGNGFGAKNVTITVGGIEAQVMAATGHDASFVVPYGISPGQPIEVVVMNPGGRLATIQWVACGFDCSAIDCTSDNECVEDGTCDPATGMCIDGGNQPADTACGDGDVCDDQGNCVECNDDAQCTEDGNECTQDVCDPADGTCINSNLPGGTDCDAAGLPGECDSAGACVAVCTPTPGVTTYLPASVPDAVLGPTYTDIANGFKISAVNCRPTPAGCDITSTFRGLGSNAYGAGLAFDPSDSFLVEFFDQNGNPRTASNVAIVLHPQGTSGTADVRIDGGLAVSVPMFTGNANIVSVASAHAIEVTSTSGFVFWQQLDNDHDCL